ncbi:MAG: CBS domain-containing protein, partial [Akkermansiaceae bacterium]|nr:CBS domain-containing protein [Akkermansiaceae bacterium]
DVRTNAGMISHRKVIKVTTNDTFLTAYRRMLAAEIRCVPVEDEQGNLCGILRYIDLLRLLLPADTEGLSVRTVHASLAHIAATLQAETVGPDPMVPDEEEDLILPTSAGFSCCAETGRSSSAWPSSPECAPCSSPAAMRSPAKSATWPKSAGSPCCCAPRTPPAHPP